jgi:aspartyl-tRNA(Asn)/glutamyl-tRNA(Gln) amidotransferase subunit A
MNGLPETLAGALEALRSRRIGAVELTEAMLGRARDASALGCFIHLDEEAALAAARPADDGGAGALLGVPLAMKDVFATAKMPTSGGSRLLTSDAPESGAAAWARAWAGRDATSVGALRAAGAVLVGKLSLHELATGWPTIGPDGIEAETALPVARNPWDAARAPGGSSSGTGAAVAAGLVFGGLGSDTNGSIRHPAAYCGITGLKPTYGRVSKAGCLPLGFSFDHVGPMARTARDCALLLQTIAGQDPLDPTSAAEPVPDYLAALDGSLGRVRIGVLTDGFRDAPALDDEARSSLVEAADVLRRAGATVVEAAIPCAPAARAAAWVASRVEAFSFHRADLRARPELIGRGARRVFHVGAVFTAADYVQAQRVRALSVAQVGAALREVDVLLAPTMTSGAPPYAGYDPDGSTTGISFTAIWSLTGNPVLSVPCGFSSEGLPLAMQVIGRPFDEATVLRVGDAYQRLTDWHERRPSPPPSIAPEVGSVPEGGGPSSREVDALLRQHDLTLDDLDRARLARIYPALRAMAAALETPELPLLEPAPVFRLTP